GTGFALKIFILCGAFLIVNRQYTSRLMGIDSGKQVGCYRIGCMWHNRLLQFKSKVMLTVRFKLLPHLLCIAHATFGAGRHKSHCLYKSVDMHRQLWTKTQCIGTISYVTNCNTSRSSQLLHVSDNQFLALCVPAVPKTYYITQKRHQAPTFRNKAFHMR